MSTSSTVPGEAATQLEGGDDLRTEGARIAHGLADLIRSAGQWTEHSRITDLLRISNGFARENWEFTLETGVRHEATRRRMILRRDPEASLLDTDRVVEFEILQALEGAPAVRAPIARWVDVDGRWTGRPALIMDKIERGRCNWFPFASPAPLASRLEFGRNYVQLLAAVHSAGVRDLLVANGLEAPAQSPASAEIDRWTRTLRTHQLEPYPELEYARVWLERHIPVCHELALVHGDFKPGNMLVDGPEIVGLLDWETAHIGDPVEDLGWVTNPVRRREHQLEGIWEVDEILAEYQRVSGRQVSRASLRFWNVLANYKLAIIFVTGMQAFVSGLESRIYWGPEEVIGPLYTLMEE